MFSYALFDRNDVAGGSAPYPAPLLPMRHGVGGALDAETASAPIEGPCELHIYSDDDFRLDCRLASDSGSLDAAGSPVVAPAGVAVYSLPKGTFVIAWSAVA